MLYLAEPPQIQILHCLRQSEQGGESLFSDTYRAAKLVRQEGNSLLQSLIEFPVTYRYQNDGFRFEQTRPTIETERLPNSYGSPANDNPYFQPEVDIKAVNWSPPFQAPFLYSFGDRALHSDASDSFKNYFKAIKTFKRLIEDPASVFETKLEEGTCVIFNNRRLVHARKAFSEEGKRWLRGAYVDQDCFSSRMRTLEKELGTEPIQ